MADLSKIRRTVYLLLALLTIWATLLVPALSARQEGERPLQTDDFIAGAPQGFGDRQNTIAWSMVWWKNSLFVGTARSWRCVEAAAIHEAYPLLQPYPPRDADIECAGTPQDLDLRAEIWRWSPANDTWKRVYQSPNDVPIPGYPGKFVARDIGFRSMQVVREADGTEALYVGGVSSKAFNDPGFDSHRIPSPRILRSTDGVNFAAVPAKSGTFMGDYNKSSFRDMAVFGSRLYAVGGTISGEGELIESGNPRGGDNNYRVVTPPGMEVYAVAVYRNWLYLGLADRNGGYTVVKTNATGPAPYTYQTVVPYGGFLPTFPSKSVVSMHVFKNRLYIGTDRPSEIIRINPDDSWDLIVGQPRLTPAGWKYPLSGMSAGFDYFLNAHIWQMEEHNGVLYVGTMDPSTSLRTVPLMDRLLGPQMGFDLFASTDGQHFRMITRTGFDDPYSFGVRTMASTPQGLFLGSANAWFGMQVWRACLSTEDGFAAASTTAALAGDAQSNYAYLPLISGAPLVQAIENLQSETASGGVALAWESIPAATRYQIYRSDFSFESAVAPLNESLSPSSMVSTTADIGDASGWMPGSFHPIGLTSNRWFVDADARPGQLYEYYVIAEDADGRTSESSNIAGAFSLAPPTSLAQIQVKLLSWTMAGGLPATPVGEQILPALAQVHDLVNQGDLAAAEQALIALRQTIADDPQLSMAWRSDDLKILLMELAQRVYLARNGIIPVIGL